MSLRADYDPKYFLRFLLIAIGCFGYIGWCLYDAQIKYPAELERAEIYWQPSSKEGKKYNPMERKNWREIVTKNQWPTKAPRKPDKIAHSIQSQYFYAGICAVIGIPCLIKWFRARGSWIEGSDSGLTTSWGTSFQYKDIVSIDKTKWAKKGIAKISFSSDNKSGKFVFDDFKYIRSTMSEILNRIESGLKDNQIVGGERESVTKERKKKADLAAASESGISETEGSDV